MHSKLIFSLILVGLTVLFVIQNVAVVEISFLFWSASMSRSLLIFFLLALGIIIGWLMHSYFMHRQNISADE
ncbi:MAG: LapA family protein [Proteobacteria bacterium]|nr:LapA family protein [Pseudomonadota bacterium]MBU1687512.1 LapA family protein [Pseudomonadota bacterium]